MAVTTNCTHTIQNRGQLATEININRLPDFFIVGASKAGTTSICEALASHKDICFSTKKEPNFFSEFDPSLKEIPHERLLAYTRLFCSKNPQQLLGEGSVKYLDSSNAAYWIKTHNPSAKIVIVLRNPIQRIVSLYEMYSRLGIMTMNSEQAFALDIASPNQFAQEQSFCPHSLYIPYCMNFDKLNT